MDLPIQDGDFPFLCRKKNRDLSILVNLAHEYLEKDIIPARDPKQCGG